MRERDDGELARVEAYLRSKRALPPPPELVETVVRPAAEIHLAGPRLGRLGPRRSAALAGAFVGAVLVLLVALLPSVLAPARLSVEPGSRPGLTRFDAGGFSFEYPSLWRAYDASLAASGSSVTGLLGTVEVDPACGTAHVDINCFYAQRLQPGTLALVVGGQGFRGGTFFDALADADQELDIAGLPVAYFSGEPNAATASDENLRWLVPMPGTVSNAFWLDAALRGPGLEGMRRELGALVTSLRFDAPVERLPTGPGAEEAAAAAVRVAIDGLDLDARENYDSEFYACMPREPGNEHPAVITAGPGGPLDGPLEVTCATAVVPTRLELWQLTLSASWEAGPGYAGGRYEELNWLQPDGSQAGRHTPEGPPFPSTTPPASPAPNETLPAFDPGTVLEVLPPGSQVWLTPAANADMLGYLNPGDRVYVVRGPVETGGRPWYRVQWQPTRSFVAILGWLPAVEDDRPLVQPVEPDCPIGAPDVAALVRLIPAERLLCFGRGELDLAPVIARADEPDVPVEGDPAWLAEESPLRLEGPSPLDGSLRVRLGADTGGPLPVEQWLEVHGHFDDPAAATCIRRFPPESEHSAGLSPESPEEQVLRCREEFVVTEFRAVPAPG